MSPDRLLIALLREDARAAEAAAAATDPAVFVRLVQHHRLESYLHARCATNGTAGLLPPDVQAVLARGHREAFFLNLALLATARPILSELNREGIEPILLKGSALIGRVYPDLGARALTDIDLLVPAERFEEARRLVAGHGFRYDPGTLRSGRREAFEGDRPGASLDLHWELSQKHRFQAEIEAVWRDSVPVPFEGARARRLAPTHEFVYLALHYAAHYFGVTLKWLVDLRELLRAEHLSPNEVAVTAARWRGTAGLHFALRYLDLVYGDAIDLRAYRQPLRRPIRDLLIRPFLSDDPLLLVHPLERGSRRLLMGLLFVDRPSDMIRLGLVTHVPD